MRTWHSARWFPSLLAALIASSCSPSDQSSPTAAVEGLYSRLIDERVTGAPTPEQLQRLSPFLSDTLVTLLAGARRLHDEEARLHPDEKPPFVEGDLFSSLFEGASSFSVLGPDGGSADRVVVEFVYDQGGSRTTWSDIVVTVRDGDSWVVDDVIYQGGWDFASTGTLRENLELALLPGADPP